MPLGLETVIGFAAGVVTSLAQNLVVKRAENAVENTSKPRNRPEQSEKEILQDIRDSLARTGPDVDYETIKTPLTYTLQLPQQSSSNYLYPQTIERWGRKKLFLSINPANPASLATAIVWEWGGAKGVDSITNNRFVESFLPDQTRIYADPATPADRFPLYVTVALRDD